MFSKLFKIQYEDEEDMFTVPEELVDKFELFLHEEFPYPLDDEDGDNDIVIKYDEMQSLFERFKRYCSTNYEFDINNMELMLDYYGFKYDSGYSFRTHKQQDRLWYTTYNELYSL